jgi:zinc transporter 9
MIGILVHSAVDGLALGAISVSNNQSLELVVFLAIILHKAPASFGLSSFLIYQGRSKKDVMKQILIFSLMAPLTALLTFIFFSTMNATTSGTSDSISSPKSLGLCLLFSAGTFLFTIAVHILPEVTSKSHTRTGQKSSSSPHHHDINEWKYTWCLVGGILLPWLISGYSHSHGH